jgi:SOS-response transcriptional repressor LexA
VDNFDLALGALFVLLPDRLFSTVKGGHMEINLPPGQKKVVLAIRKLSESGRNPTMQEIANFTGARSVNSVFNHLAYLQKKGIVKPRRHRAKRAIELAEEFAA